MMEVGVSKINFGMLCCHSQEGDVTVFQYTSEIEIVFILIST
jgi:hypothetical protein